MMTVYSGVGRTMVWLSAAIRATSRSLSATLVLSLTMIVVLAGCGGSGSSADNGADDSDSAPDEDTAPEALRLSASSDIMQMHLDWQGAEAVDILYSSDPECDWDNYSLCPDAGMLTNVQGAEASIGAVEHGLSTDSGWYFVVEAGDRRSPQASARATVPSFGGYQLYALETDGELLFAGGNFGRVALATGGLAMFDAQQNNTLTGVLPYMDGRVHAIVGDGSGGWIVAGEFDQVGGHDHQNLVKLSADGTVESAWQVDVNGPVRALAVQGERVFIGGDFTELTVDQDARYSRANLAAIDIPSGLPVTGWNPVVSGSVSALASSDARLYIGGDFTQVDGGSRNHLAAVHIDSGQLDSGWTPSANGPVNALLHDAEAVFAGGLFTEVTDDARENVVKIDAVSGGVDTQWDPGKGGEVFALALWQDRLLVGGALDIASSDERLSVIDRNNGALDEGWDLPPLYDDVHGLAVDGDQVYIITERNLFALDAQQKETTSWDASIGASFVDGPRAVAATSDNVLVGGEFYEAGGERFSSIAVMDIDTGILQEPLAGSVGQVYELLHHDGWLYAGGSMSFSSGQRSLAAFDLSTMARDEQWNATASSSRDVSGLAIHGGTLYAGGRFEKVGDVDVVRVTGFDLLSGDLSDFSEPPAPNDTVNALAVFNNQLLMGGRFDIVAGQAQEHLVALDMTDGSIATGWTLEASNSVNTFHQSSDSSIYVGGRFNTLGGDSKGGIARLVINNSSVEVDNTWAPSASNAMAVATGPHRVFVGRGIARDAPDGLMAFSRYGSGERVDDWDPAPDISVNALLYHEGKLFVGGWFQELGGKHRNLFGVLDAESGEVLW